MIIVIYSYLIIFVASFVFQSITRYLRLNNYTSMATHMKNNNTKLKSFGARNKKKEFGL